MSPSGGARSGQPALSSAPEYGTTGPPSINVHRSAPQAPQTTQFPANSHASSNVPGALQPGNVNRSGAPSGNTAPNVPTLPQLSTQQSAQQPTTPSKAPQNTGYSRTSPSGFDQQQMYKSDDGKFVSPGSGGAAGGGGGGPASQTPQSTPYSPLGLADIRPLMDSADEPAGPGPSGQLDNGGLSYPTNSNYLAPWGVYALDWCKWPTRPNSPSVGKVALGSYLEDHHNYVRLLPHKCLCFVARFSLSFR